MSSLILNIIKAQIKYVLYNLHGTLIIFAGIYLYSYFREFNPINILSFLFFVQYVSLVLLSNNKEGRELTFRLLTLSARDIATSRVLLVLFGFIIVYTISFGLNYFVFQPGNDFRDGYHELFMFGAIGLLGIFLYLTIADYFSIFKNRRGSILFNTIAAVIIGIISFGVIFSVKSSFDNSESSSSILIVVIYLCSFVLAAISLFTYQNRESYMGYR